MLRESYGKHKHIVGKKNPEKLNDKCWCENNIKIYIRELGSEVMKFINPAQDTS